MKNSEAIKMTKERQKLALNVLKRIETRLKKFQVSENANWGDAGSMGALLDKLLETETYSTYLD